MTLLLLSFVAGLLTVLAPCVLPMLPVIVGGTLAQGGGHHRAITMVTSLALSLFIFTLILKVSTALISIPTTFWTYISGGIITFIGISFLFTGVWEKMIGMTSLGSWSNRLVGQGYLRQTRWGDVIMGSALGPVFATCSPIYFAIIATVLPVSMVTGITYLIAYVAGIAVIMLCVIIGGNKVLSRFNMLADPRGIFKRIIGIVLVIVGIAIMTGYDKELQKRIVTSNSFFDVTQIEERLLGSLSD